MKEFYLKKLYVDVTPLIQRSSGTIIGWITDFDHSYH